ncbi:uncharacterized protein LOC142772242 [Rhipicephalus microplus]|uniref:uncharacterized protein LOC142772242 n=1 Tax=Rhipicephalus microplus TaxID=6941 RepID=UPI003F6B3D30
MASLSMVASTLTAPPDPTETMPTGYLLLRFGENARKNLELLYDGVTGALASIKLQRWIDDVTYTLLRKGKTQLLESTVTLLVLSGVLWMLLRMCQSLIQAYFESCKITHLPYRSQQGHVRVDWRRRCLTAFTDTEEDACQTLRRRNRTLIRSKTRFAVLRDGRSRERSSSVSGLNRRVRFNDELDAARLIQRWVRTNFQPWVAARKGGISGPPNPVDHWTDRDTGAVAVTLVDHDSMSAIEQSGESSLADVQLDGLGPTTDVRLVDNNVGRSSSGRSPRSRQAATISSSCLLTSRNQADGLSAEDAPLVVEIFSTATPEHGQQ